MRILNLTNKSKSDIKWELSSFPDGQQQVKTGKFEFEHQYQIMTNTGIWKCIGLDKSVQIKSRLNNFQDLERIICATQSLKQLGVEDIHLYVPYFLGSRSDRQFSEGENNYLKHVICPLINLQGYKSVTVLDPHSDVLEACLNGFKKESTLKLNLFAFKDIYNLVGDQVVFEFPWEKFILVSPDAGASKKIYKLAEQLEYHGDIITCSKDRDENGKLTKCVVPYEDHHCGKDVIIIDDICDGGATFINIAKYFKNADFPKSKIYLIVTHGIFSKGFGELIKYFDGIYCTNSYKDAEFGPPLESGFCVEQLDVFK